MAKISRSIIQINRALVANNEFMFIDLLKKLTLREVAEADNQKLFHENFVHMLWSNSATYGQEIAWAQFALASEEEKVKIAEECSDFNPEQTIEEIIEDMSPPDNFDIDCKIGDLNIWSPMDYYLDHNNKVCVHPCLA